MRALTATSPPGAYTARSVRRRMSAYVSGCGVGLPSGTGKSGWPDGVRPRSRSRSVEGLAAGAEVAVDASRRLCPAGRCPRPMSVKPVAPDGRRAHRSTAPSAATATPRALHGEGLVEEASGAPRRLVPAPRSSGSGRSAGRRRGGRAEGRARAARRTEGRHLVLAAPEEERRLLDGPVAASAPRCSAGRARRRGRRPSCPGRSSALSTASTKLSVTIALVVEGEGDLVVGALVVEGAKRTSPTPVGARPEERRRELLLVDPRVVERDARSRAPGAASAMARATDAPHEWATTAAWSMPRCSMRREDELPPRACGE